MPHVGLITTAVFMGMTLYLIRPPREDSQSVLNVTSQTEVAPPATPSAG